MEERVLSLLESEYTHLLRSKEAHVTRDVHLLLSCKHWPHDGSRDAQEAQGKATEGLVGAAAFGSAFVAAQVRLTETRRLTRALGVPNDLLTEVAWHSMRSVSLGGGTAQQTAVIKQVLDVVHRCTFDEATQLPFFKLVKQAKRSIAALRAQRKDFFAKQQSMKVENEKHKHLFDSTMWFWQQGLLRRTFHAWRKFITLAKRHLGKMQVMFARWYKGKDAVRMYFQQWITYKESSIRARLFDDLEKGTSELELYERAVEERQRALKKKKAQAEALEHEFNSEDVSVQLMRAELHLRKASASEIVAVTDSLVDVSAKLRKLTDTMGQSLLRTWQSVLKGSAKAPNGELLLAPAGGGGGGRGGAGAGAGGAGAGAGEGALGGRRNSADDPFEGFDDGSFGSDDFGANGEEEDKRTAEGAGDDDDDDEDEEKENESGDAMLLAWLKLVLSRLYASDEGKCALIARLASMEELVRLGFLLDLAHCVPVPVRRDAARACPRGTLALPGELEPHNAEHVDAIAPLVQVCALCSGDQQHGNNMRRGSAMNFSRGATLGDSAVQAMAALAAKHNAGELANAEAEAEIHGGAEANPAISDSDSDSDSGSDSDSDSDSSTSTSISTSTSTSTSTNSDSDSSSSISSDAATVEAAVAVEGEEEEEKEGEATPAAAPPDATSDATTDATPVAAPDATTETPIPTLTSPTQPQRPALVRLPSSSRHKSMRRRGPQARGSTLAASAEGASLSLLVDEAKPVVSLCEVLGAVRPQGSPASIYLGTFLRLFMVACPLLPPLLDDEDLLFSELGDFRHSLQRTLADDASTALAQSRVAGNLALEIPGSGLGLCSGPGPGPGASDPDPDPSGPAPFRQRHHSTMMLLQKQEAGAQQVRDRDRVVEALSGLTGSLGVIVQDLHAKHNSLRANSSWNDVCHRSEGQIWGSLNSFAVMHGADPSSAAAAGNKLSATAGIAASDVLLRHTDHGQLLRRLRLPLLHRAHLAETVRSVLREGDFEDQDDAFLETLTHAFAEYLDVFSVAAHRYRLASGVDLLKELRLAGPDRIYAKKLRHKLNDMVPLVTGATMGAGVGTAAAGGAWAADSGTGTGAGAGAGAGEGSSEVLACLVRACLFVADHAYDHWEEDERKARGLGKGKGKAIRLLGKDDDEDLLPPYEDVLRLKVLDVLRGSPELLDEDAFAFSDVQQTQLRRAFDKVRTKTAPPGQISATSWRNLGEQRKGLVDKARLTKPLFLEVFGRCNSVPPDDAPGKANQGLCLLEFNKAFIALARIKFPSPFQDTSEKLAALFAIL